MKQFEPISDLLKEMDDDADELKYALMDILRWAEEAIEYPAEGPGHLRGIAQRAKEALAGD